MGGVIYTGAFMNAYHCMSWFRSLQISHSLELAKGLDQQRVLHLHLVSQKHKVTLSLYGLSQARQKGRQAETTA